LGRTAYRSKANVTFMAENGFTSRLHRKKPPGRPMPVRTARANGKKSKIRAKIEHVFAEQKGRMGLFIRTVGLDRARTKIGLANLVYNVKRLIVLERWAVLAAA
jgi:transposase, IS5 family